MKRVVIAAPYWRQPGHLGCVRVERFIRWLGGAGVATTVVRAGSSDRVETTPWGIEVTVRDPIGFYRDLPEGRYPAIPLRRTSRLRRTISSLLLVPDPLVAWARRAARAGAVREAGLGAGWVIASSPPESVHVAAARLADALGTRLLLDLRDGWLDEPVIPLLRSSRLQRWRHGRLERRLLGRADRIVVTSEHWRRLLVERLPFTSDRTWVLTNACPLLAVSGGHRRDRRDGPLTLVYAGKLASGRAERRTGQLLEPLVAGLDGVGVAGRLLFVGNLTGEERHDLETWGGRLAGLGWRLEVAPPVPRERALELIASAGGLLLLSASTASLPAKLFDYLPSGRPILAVAQPGSAVWELGRRLPQVHLVGLGDANAAGTVRQFIDRCRAEDRSPEVPEELGDAWLGAAFLRVLGVPDGDPGSRSG